MTRPIRITQVLEATGGGTRRHLRDLVANLPRDSFAISVICSEGRDSDFNDDVRWMTDRGIEVRVVPMARSLSPFRDTRTMLMLRRALGELDPDIVHTHSTKAGITGRYAAKKCGIRRTVHTPHCWPFEFAAPVPVRWLAIRLERYLATITAKIVCVCDSERRAALDNRIAPHSKLVTVCNGIDSKATLSDLPCAPTGSGSSVFQHLNAAGPDIVTIAVVGRMCRQKGQLWFLEAVAPLVRERQDVRLVLVGDGPDRPRIEQTCERLKLSGRCMITGWLPQPNRFFDLFSIVVLPSLWEALPYVLLDAMVRKKAIVASDVGGMRELLEEGGGLLVAPGDAVALSEALTGLIENRSQREQLGRRAVQQVGKCTIEAMVSGLSSVYMSLIDSE